MNDLYCYYFILLLLYSVLMITVLSITYLIDYLFYSTLITNFIDH